MPFRHELNVQFHVFFILTLDALKQGKVEDSKMR